MALTNFVITVVGVGAAFLLLRSDIKTSAGFFRRNVRQIRTWLEEESANAAKEIKSKEVEGHARPKEAPKDAPKDDKH